ncbi:lysylphosphatidylglycerol synthase domain-containing protein [Novosphingobium sp. Gsoil 351]|uniref:lysylphosphatidylglycerol synthase domain-containing protein n=1 Tax=Novosphingobium sp. Gsoil 351 TaxID=2675225 RepID=UPI0012B484F1|nr:lysylphosphatidylglycerol synthase domain-containing protein [Novosphingobium sp. Gsoil 351]QGN56106.1 hypothetical protein GKE62_17700 [Novosphingobium sp. Gsoil 351]
MTQANRFPFAIVSGITFLVMAIWLFRAPQAFSARQVPHAQAAFVSIGCVGLYLVSHLLRAIRLAVIGVYIHKTSFRTLALLNLSVAPWSMIAPFKLDEFIRLNELRTVNGSLPKALITIVIDRSMDGPMFLAFAVVLVLGGMPGIALFVGIFGIGMIAVTIGFFAASRVLHFIQSYIFLHHYKPRALQSLQIVHQLRQLASLGRETIKSTAPILVVCTIGIWLFEIGAVALMLSVFSPAHGSLSASLAETLVRANSGWRTLLLLDQLGVPSALTTRLFFAGLLIVWPLTIWFYCRRRMLEVSNADFLGRHWGPTVTRA